MEHDEEFSRLIRIITDLAQAVLRQAGQIEELRHRIAALEGHTSPVEPSDFNKAYEG